MTGTHSLKYSPVGTSTDAFAYATIDDGDGTASFRFYFRFNSIFANVASGQVLSLMEVDSAAPPSGTVALRVELRRNSGNVTIRMTGADTSDGMKVVEDTWYRAEVQAVQNSTSTLKVFTNRRRGSEQPRCAMHGEQFQPDCGFALQRPRRE